MAFTSLLVLVALASSAIAQTTTMMPAPTMLPTTAPMTTEAEMTTQPPMVDEVSAATVQRDHFFCLGNGSSRRDFITTPSGDVNAVPPVYPVRWGLWIQYPVLSYLDTMRKRHLFYVISEMVDSVSNPSAGISNLFNRICIAEVEQYGVSTYRESVFVKLYLSNSDSIDTLRDLDMAFRRAYGESNYVVPFLDRRAINVIARNLSSGRSYPERTVSDSVHPGCDIDSCPEGDPTLLAIVLGTYVGPAYYGPYSSEEYPEEVTVENLESGSLPSPGRFYRLNEFAENPRPINYGLEAGDIVFAVFGSIFLTILSGAIILGFVIHPFCLA